MIEKIIRAVKSNNKKRGRNITIGAVVGMLLSCSAVMGADDYLWIKNNSGTIEFSKDNGTKWEERNPYSGDNSWNGKTYINNITLSGTDNGKDEDDNVISYGLKLSGDLEKLNFMNNGILNVTITTNNSNHGIYVDSSAKIGNIENNGLINNNSNDSGSGITIYSSLKIENISNSGVINVPSNGMNIESMSQIEKIVNDGIIMANNASIAGSCHSINILSPVRNIINNGLINSANDTTSHGITISSTVDNNILNKGIINSNGTGFGIYIGSSAEVNNITNKGIVYGSVNAIRNDGGTLINANSYGLLVAENFVVSDKLTIVVHDNISSDTNLIKNYGLVFIYDGSDYKKDDSNISNFGTVYNNVDIGGTNYTIRNVGATVNGSNGTITGWKSFKIENGALFNDNSVIIDSSSKSNFILNGIENTLLVIGNSNNNALDNGTINAYGTAIKFYGTENKLALLGVTVNGGIKDNTHAIEGSSEKDILLIQNESIVNGNIDMGGGDDEILLNFGTRINGDINMGTGDDTLAIENGTQINGTLTGGVGGENNILNFVSSSTKKALNKNEIRVLYNISNFEKINVNSNVTFYEKTLYSSDLSDNSLKITGANEIKIGTDGTLTLRIDGTDKDSSNGKIKGHALYGNTGTITSEGGKFFLALNGAGKQNIISFNNTTFGTGLEEGSEAFGTTSKLHTVERVKNTDNEIMISSIWDLPDYLKYPQLNKIYHGILSVDDLIGNFNVDDDEKLSIFLGYLNDIYVGNPYSYSSELSRKSAEMFRDIVTDNQFKANTGKWMIYGGLTHVDGGTKDTYYGKGYYTYDIGSSDMDAETKITGAYMLGEYGVSDTLTSGVVIGGNKLKSDLSNGSKVDGSAMYLGAYAKKYIGNIKVTAGAGFQYGDDDTDRMAVNRVAFDSAESVMKYSDNYNDITYDIYLNGRYSHNIGNNLFLEPYATLSYTYIDQDGANEGSKTLAIETDSKSFDYTVGKVGVDLKKVIPHEKGKSTLSAGVSYTKILDGAEEEYITGRFKNGSDFDILVAHKNEHSIGLNAKYAIELENGILFDVKGTYSVERDSHNNSGKNKTKGEWIVGAGMGYKF
ncbi:hypothetical protein F350042L8_04110 [Fusobacterium ulcerans]|uniref:autotransporter family protein n=1 Tax=Fusobacterium ulcerans TaxID=861 RepID=UPI0034AEAA2D